MTRALATPEEVSEYLGVPPRTLEAWRHRQTGPRWSKVGRHVRYRWPDVEKWLDTQSSVAGAA